MKPDEEEEKKDGAIREGQVRIDLDDEENDSSMKVSGSALKKKKTGATGASILKKV